MKGRFFVCMVCVLMCTAMLFGMSGKKKAQDAALRTVSETGLIKVMGNEPHTWLLLVTQDGSKYAIEAENDTLSALRQMQGVLLEITGVLEPAQLEGKAGFQQASGGTILVQEFSAVKAKD